MKYLYRWSTPAKVNVAATHQNVRFRVTRNGVMTESGYSQLWDEPEITKELETGDSYTLDVREQAGTEYSPWSPPTMGVVMDEPVQPPQPPPPPGLPNTPTTPVLLSTIVLP